MVAAYNGHVAAVGYLVDRGADVNARDEVSDHHRAQLSSIVDERRLTDTFICTRVAEWQ